MEEPNNAEDTEHLSALSVGHYIMAGLTAISAIPLVAWAFAGAKIAEQLANQMALMMGISPDKRASTRSPAPPRR